jgi:hypothetical protein
MEVRDFFPNRFDFFHLGSVEQQKPRFLVPDNENLFIVSFQLESATSAHCAVAFNRLELPTDEMQSMAVEMSNILVSKFANEYADRTDEFMSVSPPELLDSEIPKDKLLIQLYLNALQFSEKVQDYTYESQGSKISFRFVYYPGIEGQS